MKKFKVLFIATILIFTLGPVANATHKGVININTATLEQIRQLPIINDTIAQNIVDYRNANGSFTSIKDLMKVKGITRTLLDNMKPFLVLKGETNFRADEYEKSGGHASPME
jgi:competence ComEA-like helix-hairpin-helix protein